MRKINKNRIGEKHINNQGIEFEIIDYKHSSNVTIRYSDGFIAYNVQYTHIKNKSVANPYYKSVCEVGFIGQGKYKSKINNKDTRAYSVWSGMIYRCYSEKSQESRPTFKDVTVCEHWHNFQNFAEWMEDNYDPETMQGWVLDKDILFKGNKIYSPDTCRLVPAEINDTLKNVKVHNNILIGVSYNIKSDNYRTWLPKNKKGKRNFKTPEEAFQRYKTTREEYIKEVADKYKGQISNEIYQAMYNYQVEITD